MENQQNTEKKDPSSKEYLKNPLVIVAFIGLVGTLSLAILGLWGDLLSARTPIMATQTAEARVLATNIHLTSVAKNAVPHNLLWLREVRD